MIEAPAIRYERQDDGSWAWFAYRVTFDGGRPVSTFCVGIFDSDIEAAEAAEAAR